MWFNIEPIINNSTMWKHKELNQSLAILIRNKKIIYAGNAKLKIYGTLGCPSGKRMKIENRVFFADEAEAIAFGFRPCKRCMK
jgi:methylphosphotriester-DNA--protein-cysteine methyltransferase